MSRSESTFWLSTTLFPTKKSTSAVSSFPLVITSVAEVIFKVMFLAVASLSIHVVSVPEHVSELITIVPSPGYSTNSPAAIEFEEPASKKMESVMTPSPSASMINSPAPRVSVAATSKAVAPAPSDAPSN